MTSSHLWGSIAGVAVFVLMLAPPGYWLLQRLGGTPPRAQDLSLALGAGYATVLPLLWIERLLGAPVLALPATALAVIALRREWRHWLRSTPGVLFFVLPALLGLLAAWVNGGDVRWEAGGASIRLGFDVTDRAFYGLVAQEVLREPPHTMQNPLFAGVKLTYSYFPALAGLLLHLYGGLDVLSVFQVHLPIVSFVFIGLAADRLLLEWGLTSSLARILTAFLCVLGGDLSFLFPASGVMGGERSSHFLAFCSFSAESLYYNPWMLALPLVLVSIVLVSRWLREGGRGRLLLAAWSLAALWQTKLFACAPLILAAVAAGALLRHRRLLALALAAGTLALPWIALSMVSGGAEQRPLRLGPLHPVFVSLGVHPSWQGLAEMCGPDRPALVRWPGLFAATLLVTTGGLGVRVLGAGVLARRLRSDATGLWTWLGLATFLALALGLLVVGDPLPLNGAQFLILPQLLLWTLTGPLLAGWMHAGHARRLAALLLLAASCASPLGYVLRKTMPDRFTSPTSIDRYRLLLRPETVASARWLARQRAPGRANLVADWRGNAADPGGRTSLYVAVLSAKRLVAYGETFAVPHRLADERRRQVAEVYDTSDAARAIALLESLGAAWVWVETARPLRFQSPRLRLRARSAVDVYEFVPSSPAP